jgi:hypothetical protein
MATRNITMVVDRRQAKKFSEGFAINPEKVKDDSYVNMYLHHDGYPQWRGVELANWVNYMQNDEGFTNFGDGSRIASHLVKDFHYNSQYLYPSVTSIDHQYTWIIWTGKPNVFISCWDNYTNTCVFVGEPQKLIDKYEDKQMGYTDWKDKNNNDEK